MFNQYNFSFCCINFFLCIFSIIIVIVKFFNTKFLQFIIFRNYILKLKLDYFIVLNYIYTTCFFLLSLISLLGGIKLSVVLSLFISILGIYIITYSYILFNDLKSTWVSFFITSKLHKFNDLNFFILILGFSIFLIRFFIQPIRYIIVLTSFYFLLNSIVDAFVVNLSWMHLYIIILKISDFLFILTMQLGMLFIVFNVVFFKIIFKLGIKYHV